MLIAGRAIQGAGSGGIVLTVSKCAELRICPATPRKEPTVFFLDIIVSDLCPLRKRGQYMAIILAIFGIGVALGPFLGGSIVQRSKGI